MWEKKWKKKKTFIHEPSRNGDTRYCRALFYARVLNEPRVYSLSLFLSRPLTNTHSNRTRSSLPDCCWCLPEIVPEERQREERVAFTATICPPRDRHRGKTSRVGGRRNRPWNESSLASGRAGGSRRRERIFDNPRTFNEGRARERRARIASTRVDACRGLPDLA